MGAMALAYNNGQCGLPLEFNILSPSIRALSPIQLPLSIQVIRLAVNALFKQRSI